MGKRDIYIGKSIVLNNDNSVSGSFVDFRNEKFYRIGNVNLMPEFFMTIVSDSDHWMFVSSNGALSAGRKDRNNAIFPYYTVDKIHDSINTTGSFTMLIVRKGDKRYLWEPFGKTFEKMYNIERNLLKSIYGNKLLFEEINHDLGICFKYGWYNSEEFGIVRQSFISNLNDEKLSLEIVDGIRNILPYGVNYDLQNEFSNLTDAYKKSELIEETGLGLYTLSSIPVDKAEPSESLKATTVWSEGLDGPGILISENQLEDFIKGKDLHTETDIRARRGAYLLNKEILIDPGEEKSWIIVADLNQDSVMVANLNRLLLEDKTLRSRVLKSIDQGTDRLMRFVASADGFQQSNESLVCARHFSNTLFNIMRGGLFPDQYKVRKADFLIYLKSMNASLATRYEDWLTDIDKYFYYTDLIERAVKSEDPDMLRLCYEYLPLTFSRRHGDPSRPWNIFSIETREENGDLKFYYEGNWRDIFQNWEALGISFPEYLEGMISKFLNASTADGYNPYRISRHGIDWEVPEPDDPWAYIGYWGDHQIIYLQKLLELSHDYHPDYLDELFSAEFFVYANVPYRIKELDDIIENPKDTIVFDFELNESISEEVSRIGADGRLLKNRSGNIHRVNLAEKIIVTILAKLINFIPGAGIWLNTQRPEWNDANNALVGNGASMVTLYYLRRFLYFWFEKLGKSEKQLVISEEVLTLFEKCNSVFREYSLFASKPVSDHERLMFVEKMGRAGEQYRRTIYHDSFSGSKKRLEYAQLRDFIRLSMELIDQTIRLNRRDDNLYHAYNIISITDKGISIRQLYKMLEGQVAVLSSGTIDPEEGLQILEAMKNSDLYREDQYSYLLYPDRELTRFIDKNIIPQSAVRSSRLLNMLIDNNNSEIIGRDTDGNYHFNGSLRNSFFLEDALDKLDKKEYDPTLSKERKLVLDIYEKVFEHKYFTGRSGTFYGYEGLGCIYWHMVSKLLVAVQELYFKAVSQDAPAELTGRIRDHYYEIKAGIGFYKSPDLYGAFPTDPYSHTPPGSGVRQPGMTGQVKEDFITRMRELGVTVHDGKIHFNTSLLNPDELLIGKDSMVYFNTNGLRKEISLSKNQLAFTFCQVPVIYSIDSENRILISYSDGKEMEVPGNTIDKEISDLIFKRSGLIETIEVHLEN